jgi:tRNA modification GTPase
MLTDVIAAIATPPGRSAVALLRVSGAGAFEIAGSVLQPFHADPTRTARRARIHQAAGAESLGEVLYLTYRAPASYTGEDAVEVFTHGGLLAPAEGLAALLAAGAREAARGEFTRRAVQNGKLDLLQAEAVADLVDATTPAQRRAAVHQMERGLSSRIDALREAVLDLEALVCYDIDFPDEDDGPVSQERVEEATKDVRSRVSHLLATAPEGERLRHGALAVIAGRPNAGKSSLFNALLGAERAIVTDLPGTTRDAIDAPASCDGFPFRLVDTAGLREDGDVVERLGIEVSRRYLQAADIVVFCVEAGRAITAEEREFVAGAAAPVVLARTKADLGLANAEGIAVSVLTGAGLLELRQRLAGTAFASLARGGDVAPFVTRARHREALGRAETELAEFAAARRSGLDAAVAATHLRAAVTALEGIVGVVSAEDVLDRVFVDFCVGK